MLCYTELRCGMCCCIVCNVYSAMKTPYIIYNVSLLFCMALHFTVLSYVIVRCDTNIMLHCFAICYTVLFHSIMHHIEVLDIMFYYAAICCICPIAIS